MNPLEIAQKAASRWDATVEETSPMTNPREFFIRDDEGRMVTVLRYNASKEEWSGTDPQLVTEARLLSAMATINML